jgi:hypothetical protein
VEEQFAKFDIVCAAVVISSCKLNVWMFAMIAISTSVNHQCLTASFNSASAGQPIRRVLNYGDSSVVSHKCCLTTGASICHQLID